jgi:hypothetical protein
MSEVQIGDQTYLCGRMPARKQFHVARRLTPIIKHLTPLFAAAPQVLIADGNGTMVPAIGAISIFDGIAALTDTIGEISDTDADYVIDNCLDAVKFASGGGWAPLRAAGSPPGTGIMLPAADRIDVQLRLVWEVLRENLSNFSLETLLPSQTGNGLATAPA